VVVSSDPGTVCHLRGEIAGIVGSIGYAGTHTCTYCLVLYAMPSRW
jgi:hypothetical protein